MAITQHDREKGAIEAILSNNTLFDSLGLTPNDFTDQNHRKAFRGIAELIEKGVNADIMSVMDICDLPATHVASYDPVSGAQGVFIADYLKEATRQRGLEHLARVIIDEVGSRKDSGDILTTVEIELQKIAERRDMDVPLIKDKLSETISHIEALYHAKGGLLGITSGYDEIDFLTAGFQPGDVIVIAARTSIGKTALATCMAEKSALKGIIVGYFTLEMASPLLIQRILSGQARISHQEIRSGMMTPAMFDSLGNAADRMHDTKIYIDDTPAIPFSQLRSKARIMKRKGVQIIYIDYLTLIKWEGEKGVPRFERIGEMVAQLKSLARELDIPIVVLSQLNRDAEGNNPSMAELRQSGEIEEHADTIILLHRERVPEEGQKLIETTVDIAKQRNGPTGKLTLMFMPEYVRFEPQARGEQ